MKLLIGDNDNGEAVLIRPVNERAWTEFSAMITRNRDVFIRQSRDVDQKTPVYLIDGESGL
jgi:hypothetical protein